MPYCRNCGKEISADIAFCPSCGVAQPTQPVVAPTKPSKTWYLLPILLGLLGGIIAFISLRKRDRKMARNTLLVGVPVFLLFLIGLGAYYSTPLYGEAASITQFFVLKEGDTYRARFSLFDANQAETAADGTVTFRILDETGELLYESTFRVSKNQFMRYRIILTGAEILAYAWTFPALDVTKGTGLFGTATLEFRTDSKVMTGESAFVELR